MKISGIQKLTLLDYPGKVACTVFLGGCNFRCPYCHNSELLGSDAQMLMETDELLAFLEKRTGILEGVCITGGEPTIAADLIPFLQKIKDMGFAVKLDTNGYRPDVLKAAASAGLLDYVAMDIKNSPTLYGTTCGIQRIDMDKIEESIQYLVYGSVEHEFRTTVVEPLHTLDSIKEMCSWFLSTTNGRKAAKMFIQPFVDRDTVAVSGLASPDAKTLEMFRKTMLSCAENVGIRGV